MDKWLRNIAKIGGFITNSGGNPDSSKSREISTQTSREMANLEVKKEAPDVSKPEDLTTIGESKIAEACPYCHSRNFVKRGMRKNKYQVVQLYICKNQECGKTFTAQDVKGKHFPLKLIIEAMSYYNLGFTLEGACDLIKQKFALSPNRLL